MLIIEALKSGKWYKNLRVWNGYRWLIWDDTIESWVVFSRSGPDREQHTIIETRDEEEAVMYLLYQEEVEPRWRPGRSKIIITEAVEGD